MTAPEFDQSSFNRFALDNQVVGFYEKPILLKSGRESHWYVNWRKAAEDVYKLDRLAGYVLDFAKSQGMEPDTFYGVPEGATKLGIAAQFLLAWQSSNYGPGSHVVSMGRGKSKEHGQPQDRFFLGVPRGKTIVLEDVTTTGDSLLSTIGVLKGAGVKVIAALGMTNRMEKRSDGFSVEEAVRKTGVRYYALSKATDLLRETYLERQSGEEIARLVEKEFSQYGVENLILKER